MWPFCQKKGKKEPEEPFNWDAWANKYPPGKEFEYLGIRFIIARNLDIAGFALFPIVTANYVDKDGVIHSKCFMKAEMDRII